MIFFTVFGKFICKFVMLEIVEKCSEYFLLILFELLRTGGFEGLFSGLLKIGV